jgi:iron(III) transport system substrate-binding protein
MTMTRRLGAALALLSLAAAAHAAPLTVYAAMGYDQAVVRAFTQATGIPVELVHLSTGPLLARVQAEGAHAQWDVLWFDGNLAMRSFAMQHRLACGWAPSVRYTAQGRALEPPDHCWAPVGVTYAGVMLVDTARLAAAAQPRSWADLDSPALRGRVGMDNPSISGPTYPLLAGVLQDLGVARGQRYFETLKTNGLRVYPTNSVTLRALQFGQIDVAVVQSSAALGYARGKRGLRVVMPPPSTELPSDLAIGAQVHGAQLAAARRFVEFVLSAPGQQALQHGDPAADSNDTPLLAGIAPLPAAAALRPQRTQVLDPATWGPREGAIDAWFTAHVVR